MSSKRIIFLDIDGVLNSQLYYERRIREGTIFTGHAGNIDDQAVKYLNMLCADTGADVVVSSTWRLGRSAEELQSILESRGFAHKVISKTLDTRTGKYADSVMRGNDIHQWFLDNKEIIGKYWEYRSYVILDDDSDMLYWQRNNFIQVDPYCGITPTVVFKAAKILKGLEHNV